MSSVPTESQVPLVPVEMDPRDGSPTESPAEPDAGAEEESLPKGAQRLAQIFGLSDAEMQILGLLLESQDGIPLATLAQAVPLSGDEIFALSAPDGVLRAHGLVDVAPEAELAPLRAMDRLYPARGLFELWQRPLEVRLPPGTHLLSAPDQETLWAAELLGERPPAALLTLVREVLTARHPRLLWLSFCGPEVALRLALVLRTKQARPVVLVEAPSLVGFGAPQLLGVLRRIRRDADVLGAAVLVCEAQALGGLWHGLCAPRPPSQSAPVILAGSGALSVPTQAYAGAPLTSLAAGRAQAPLCPRVQELRDLTLSIASSAKPAEPEAQAPTEDPAVSASKLEARRKAAIDAAKAMGKAIPAEFLAPAQPAAPARPSIPPPQRSAPPAPAAAPAPPAPPTPPAEVAAPAVPAVSAPAPAPAVPAQPQPAIQPSADQIEAVVKPPAEKPEPTIPEPTQAEPTQAEPTQAEPQALKTEEPVSPSTEEAQEQPPMPLEPDAKLDEIIRVAKLTPNATQRIEILRGLAGQRHSLIIQAFRHNLTSPHPGVRAAAEEGMASIFGPNWQRGNKPIAPPIQPPRTDDGGRGPHGAF